jgi:hypothetical protein
VRYTPFLDSVGVRLKDDVPDHAASIIDSALAYIDSTIEWGEWEGRKRKPCPEQPVLLARMPLGQYHCPVCGVMCLAGLPHPSPAAPTEQDPRYPLEDYEVEYGRPWPAGYEEGQ